MIESIFLNMLGAFLQHIGTALIIGIPVYLVVLGFKYLTKKRCNISMRRCIVEFMFLGYIVTVLSVTGTLSIRLSDLNGFHMAPNLVPLVSTIRDFMSYPSSVLEQVVLNIIFFLPFGFLFRMLNKTSKNILLKTILVAVIFSTSIETLEYFIGRFMDIDDVIWNTLGAIVGSNMYVFIIKIFAVNKKEKNCSNIILD